MRIEDYWLDIDIFEIEYSEHNIDYTDYFFSPECFTHSSIKKKFIEKHIHAKCIKITPVFEALLENTSDFSDLENSKIFTLYRSTFEVNHKIKRSIEKLILTNPDTTYNSLKSNIEHKFSNVKKINHLSPITSIFIL